MNFWVLFSIVVFSTIVLPTILCCLQAWLWFSKRKLTANDHGLEKYETIVMDNGSGEVEYMVRKVIDSNTVDVIIPGRWERLLRWFWRKVKGRA